MNTENSVLSDRALEALRGKWGLAIGTLLVYAIMMAIIQSIPLAGWLISILISGPMTLGVVMFSLSISRNQNPRFEQIFDGFSNFTTAFLAYLFSLVFTLLWMLLLIIPGIIAALSYALTFYIIADDRDISPMAAIDKSKAMMDGYKTKLFLLGLRFFGWALLCLLTLGIGFFWLLPYTQVTMAKFYEDIKGETVSMEFASDPNIL